MFLPYRCSKDKQCLTMVSLIHKWQGSIMTRVDANSLQQLQDQLHAPLPIREVEAIEIEIKNYWKPILEQTMSVEQKQQFVEYFASLGFFKKYKSYGTKYAAPFGYSLFDLKDNSGFSVQVHETEKVEAFHILATLPHAFMLLGSLDEWDQNAQSFIEAWDNDTPEISPMVFRPEPGDLAIIESLNTVHTVIGCILEEYATTSYDAVTRLYDQNKGDETVLPLEHKPVSEVLEEAATLNPQRRLTKTDQWSTQELPRDVSKLVDLPTLQAGHLLVGDEPTSIEAAENKIVTLVVLQGTASVYLEGTQQILKVGETTAVPPNTQIEVRNASLAGKLRLSVCHVNMQIALADLR